MLPKSTRRPAFPTWAACLVCATSVILVLQAGAHAEPRQDRPWTKSTAPKKELPLFAKPKKEKCEEYAALTDSNPFVCIRYMNERLLEILLISARKAENSAEKIGEVGR